MSPMFTYTCVCMKKYGKQVSDQSKNNSTVAIIPSTTIHSSESLIININNTWKVYF